MSTKTVRQAHTMAQVERQFATHDACMAFLVSLKWPNEQAACPRCGATEKVYKTKQPRRWICKAPTEAHKPGYRFSPLVGTIFENTNVPLPTWFRVIFLMTQSKKGISALQVHRMIGKQQTAKKGTADKGSYRTAWYMLQRIRAAMQDGDFKKLAGVVEIDETYIGGKSKSRHRSKQLRFKGKQYGGKVGVIGAISRKGNVTARVIERMDARTAKTFVEETVASAVSLVATDEHPVYEAMDWGPLRSHRSVQHTAGEYVRGAVHTANLDSFWALLKRGIMGTFHQVSKKYLPLYVNEFAWRHNNRQNPDIFRAVLAAC